MTTPFRDVRDAFLRLYRADLEQGSLRSQAEYQACFPGFEAAIAEEYRLLEDEGEAPEAPPDPDPSDARLGPYRIVRELGRGGQAIVYLATDERLGREVALKVLRSGAVDLVESDDLRRFRREAEVSARLEHPAICSVYEAGNVDGVPYIAMRYVRGETLARRIAHSREQEVDSRSLRLGLVSATTSQPSSARSELDATLRVIETCARALHFAHGQGLVHRDVKPGNVMLTEDGEPILLDFGLARVDAAEHSLTASGVLMGSPYYMAPEQVRGEASKVDCRTDVYALGVTLYEALTLQRPFEAPSREALYRQILLQEPRPARQLSPRISRDLQVVLETAMAKERTRRYQTALDLAEDLRRVRSHEPIVARPAGPMLRLWRWAQRRPAVASLSALLLGTLAVGAVLLLHSNALLTEKVDAFTRLADLKVLESISDQTRSLPASRPEHLAGWEDWDRRARELLGRRALHEATAERLQAAVDPPTVWQRGLLHQLLQELRAFETREVPVGRRSMELVRTIAQRSLVDAKEKWAAAITAIADRARSPAYGGLTIVPQMGLVPLGPDRASGLWEFAHLGSGTVPARDDKGVLVGDETSGIVLVLLPGGATTMGTLAPDADHRVGDPRVDRYHASNESPLVDATLAPFFIGKYETTQGQWFQMVGSNPSRSGRPPQGNDRGEHPLLPLENVDWEQALRVMTRFGLALPTEAQWECAARAGTTTVWWFGNDPRELAHFSNGLDQRFLTTMRIDAPEGLPESRLDDGFPLLAPVGSFPANPFGLHDVIGNVAELMRDEFLAYGAKVLADTGQLARPQGTPDSLMRTVRGGAYSQRFFLTRSGARASVHATQPANTVGIRAARALER